MTALHEATAYDAPVTRELAAPSLPRQRSATRSAPVRAAGPDTGSHRAIPAQRSADTGRHRTVRPAPRQTLAAADPEVLEAALTEYVVQQRPLVVRRTRRRRPHP